MQLRLLLVPTIMLLLAACVAIQAPGAGPAQQESGLEGGALPPGFDAQGHRGARGLQPENTLPAFETALDLGVTTLELDLHRTADGEIVIWHDESITPDKCYLGDEVVDPRPPDPADPRTSRRSLYLSSLSLAQLRQYRCDRNPDPARFPDQQANGTQLARHNYGIVRLADLFAFVDEYSRSEHKTAAQRENARRVQYNIETKRKPGDPAAINDGFDGVNPGPFEQSIAALIDMHGLADRVIVQSFEHRSLWVMRTLNPTIRLAALTSGPARLQEMAEAGATYWSPDYRTLTPALLGEAHTQGLQVIPWTVNDPRDMQRLINMGVDGLITDRPDLLLGQN